MGLSVKIGDCLMWSHGYSLVEEIMIGTVIGFRSLGTAIELAEVRWTDDTTTYEHDIPVHNMLTFKKKVLDSIC